jgi:hypothetical protein
MVEETKAKANGAEAFTIVVKLRKAVIANGDEVMELKFREPTAADIERVGLNPINIDWSNPDNPKAIADAKAMSSMMSILAAVPPSTIRMMDTRDWNWAVERLSSFFVPMPAPTI